MKKEKAIRISEKCCINWRGGDFILPISAIKGVIGDKHKFSILINIGMESTILCESYKNNEKELAKLYKQLVDLYDFD